MLHFSLSLTFARLEQREAELGDPERADEVDVDLEAIAKNRSSRKVDFRRLFLRIGLPKDLFSYRELIFREDLFLYNSSLLLDVAPRLPVELAAHAHPRVVDQGVQTWNKRDRKCRLLNDMTSS